MWCVKISTPTIYTRNKTQLLTWPASLVSHLITLLSHDASATLIFVHFEHSLLPHSLYTCMPYACLRRRHLNRDWNVGSSQVGDDLGEMSSPQTGMPWSPYSNVIHRQPLSDSLLIILHLISLYHCLKLSSLFCFVFYCLWSLPCYIHMQTHTRKYKLHDKGTESVLVTALSPKSRTMPGI